MRGYEHYDGWLTLAFVALLLLVFLILLAYR